MTTAALPRFSLQHILIGVFMLVAAGLAVVLTPKTKLADQGPRIDLETMVPKQFGDWRLDESIIPLQISPDVQAKLDRIYNQTLSRTYVNGQGQRIMLSIAYGSDQSDSMAVHKPEVCYPAQGFEIMQKREGVLDVAGVGLPVVRLVARHNNRIEPITYWITVGGETVTGGLDRKLAQMRYGLTGSVPDGLLLRISNIDPDASRAYALQADFASALFQALNAEARKSLFGSRAVHPSV
ncbi:MAG: exosortase-associated protein EpsI, B-type [Thiobacillaceae bacterium]